MNTWTVIFLCDDADGNRHMYMEAVEAPDAVAAVEAIRDSLEPDTGWSPADVKDIITIPGEHNAVGPSQPWWS